MIPASVIDIGIEAFGFSPLLFSGNPDLSIIVIEGSYADHYCSDHDLACVTISHSNAYWDDEWENPQFPFDIVEYISNDDIPIFDSDIDAVRVGMAVIDRLHEQGEFASESLFLVAHKPIPEMCCSQPAIGSHPLPETGFSASGMRYRIG